MGSEQFDPNSWEANAVHVSAEIKRLADSYESLVVEMRKMHTEIILLKVKSGLWGLAAGCLPATIAIIYAIVK